MIPRRAIERALEHGWDDTNHAFATDGVADTDFCMRVGSWCYDFRTVALDPTFWQSLLPICECHCGKDGHAIRSINCPRTNWKNRARDFYDLILTGGDTQAFWDELLGK